MNRGRRSDRCIRMGSVFSDYTNTTVCGGSVLGRVKLFSSGFFTCVRSISLTVESGVGKCEGLLYPSTVICRVKDTASKDECGRFGIGLTTHGGM